MDYKGNEICLIDEDDRSDISFVEYIYQPVTTLREL